MQITVHKILTSVIQWILVHAYLFLFMNDNRAIWNMTSIAKWCEELNVLELAWMENAQGHWFCETSKEAHSP